MAGISLSEDVWESFGPGSTQSADFASVEITSGKDADKAGPSTACQITEAPPTRSSSEASLPALNVSNKSKWPGFRKVRYFVRRLKLRRSKSVQNVRRRGHQGHGEYRGNIFACFQPKVDTVERQIFSNPELANCLTVQSIMDRHDYDVGNLLDLLEKDIYKYFEETHDEMIKQLISEFRMAAVERLTEHFIRFPEERPKCKGIQNPPAS